MRGLTCTAIAEFLGSLLLAALVFGPVSAVLANAMFELDPVSISDTQRASAAHGLAETAAGRRFSDTFAGIAPSSVLPFILAQLVGAAVAVVLIRVLYPAGTPHPPRDQVDDVVLPHPTSDRARARE